MESKKNSEDTHTARKSGRKQNPRKKHDLTHPSIINFTHIIQKPGSQRRTGSTNGEGPLPLVAPKLVYEIVTLCNVVERESLDKEREGNSITNLNQRGKPIGDKPYLGQGQDDQD